MFSSLFPDQNLRSAAHSVSEALALHAEGLTFSELLAVLAWDKLPAGDITNPVKLLKAQKGKLNRVLDVLCRAQLLVQQPWRNSPRDTPARRLALPGSFDLQDLWNGSQAMFGENSPAQNWTPHPIYDSPHEAPAPNPNPKPLPDPQLTVFAASPQLIDSFRDKLSSLAPMLDRLRIPVSAADRECLDSNHIWMSNALDQYWIWLSTQHDAWAAKWYRTSAIRKASGDSSTDGWYPDVIVVEEGETPLTAVFNATPVPFPHLFKALREQYHARRIPFAMHWIKLPIY